MGKNFLGFDPPKTGNFKTNSPLNGGDLEDVYVDAEYPYDLDGSLGFVRISDAKWKLPHPEQIGMLLGFCPLLGLKAGNKALLDGTVAGNQAPLGGTAADLLEGDYDLDDIFPDISGSVPKVQG